MGQYRMGRQGLRLVSQISAKVATQDLNGILPVYHIFGKIGGGVYTPVDSMARCVHPFSFSQSRIASRSAVLVSYVRISRLARPSLPGVFKHTLTFFLCTSSPAHRS